MSEQHDNRLTIAFLGAGTLGAPMARNLAAAGHDVRLWNRTRSRAEAVAERVAADGHTLTVADSAGEAATGADLVLTVLRDVSAVLDSVQALRGHVASGTPLVQVSTVGVEGHEQVAQLAAELGLAYVDAPVLGTKEPAENAALTVLASGPEDLQAAVEPVFAAVAARTLWVGPAGAGQRLKLAANSWVLTVVEGVAGSLALARDLGLDPALFLEAVKGSAVDAPYVQLKGRAMLAGAQDRGALEASFPLEVAAKDAALVVAAQEQAGADASALATAVRDRLEQAAATDLARLDVAATYLLPGHAH